MNRNKTKVRKAFDNLPTTPPLGVNVVQFETLVIESPRLKQFHFEKNILSRMQLRLRMAQC